MESFIDWHLDIGNVITLVVLLGTAYRFLITQAKSQALRDQKIDLVLFGTEGQPGLVKSVEALKHEVGEPGGAVHRLKNTVHAIIVALAGKDIHLDPHH